MVGLTAKEACENLTRNLKRIQDAQPTIANLRKGFKPMPKPKNHTELLERKVCDLEERLAISNEKRVAVELSLDNLTRAHDSLKGVNAALRMENRINIAIKEAHASTLCQFASKGKRS